MSTNQTALQGEVDPAAPSDGTTGDWLLISGFNRFGCWLAGLAIILVLCLAATVAFGVQFLNDVSRAGTLHLAEVSLERQRNEVGFISRDYAVWDEAAVNLNVAHNIDWANRWIGDWAYSDMGMQMSAIVGPDDRLVFFMSDGEKTTNPDQGRLDPSLLALAKTARQAPWLEPQPVTAFLRIDGGVMLAAATPVTPESPTPQDIDTGGRHVIIFLRLLNTELINKFSTDYLLPELNLSDQYDVKLENALPLYDSAQTMIAALRWTPTRPGNLFMNKIAPWLVALVLAAFGAAVAAFFYRRRVLSQAQALMALLNKRNADMQISQQRLHAALEHEQAANAVKTNFLAFMSHELRTPLNAVIGFSEVLSTEMLGPVGSPKYLEYSHDINAAGHHLLSLIEDVLEFAKAEAGKLRFNMTKVDLVRVARLCAAQLGPRSRASAIDVTIDAAQSAVFVFGDERRLKQILLNLLTNAIKASRRHGKVRVRIRADQAGHVTLRVVDQGVGIEKSDLERVFSPFERIGRYETNPSEGIGLGLPIIKRLVDAHNGSVRILSKPGLGTMLEIKLHSTPWAESVTESDVTLQIRSA